MSSNLRSVFSFALIVLLTGFVENKEFCESLKENGNKISYGFRRIAGNDPKGYQIGENYIFIDKTYWRLQMTDDMNRTVSFAPEEGQESNDFGNNYTMAWCHPFRASDDCTLGLMNSENKIIEWSELDKSQDILKVVNKLDSQNIAFKENFRPSIASVPSHDLLMNQIVIFIDKKNPSQWEGFRIKKGEKPVGGEAWNDEIEKGYEVMIAPTALKDIPQEILTKSPVISILGQDSKIEDMIRHPHGLIVLFQEDQTIKYCYTITDELSESCKRDLKTLIECPKDKTTTVGESDGEGDSSSVDPNADPNGEETTSTSDTSENGSNLWIIIVIIVIILIIIAIIFCIFCLKQSKNEPNATEKPKAMSTTSLGNRKHADTTRSGI